MVGDSLRAISGGLLQCLAQRLLALWFHHAEALTPFQMHQRRKRKRVAEEEENKGGCLATSKNERKGSGLAELGLCVGFPLPTLH